MLTPQQLQQNASSMGYGKPATSSASPATSDWVNSLAKANPQPQAQTLQQNTSDLLRNSSVGGYLKMGDAVKNDIGQGVQSAGNAIKGTGEYQGQSTLARATGAVSDVSSIPFKVGSELIPQGVKDVAGKAIGGAVNYLADNPLSRAMGFNEGIQNLTQNHPEAAQNLSDVAHTGANLGNIAGNILGAEGVKVSAPAIAKEGTNIASDVGTLAKPVTDKIASVPQSISNKVGQIATNSEKNIWMKPTTLAAGFNKAKDIAKNASAQGHDIGNSLVNSNIKLSDHIDTSPTGRKIFDTADTAQKIQTDTNKLSNEMLRPALAKADESGLVDKTPAKNLIDNAKKNITSDKTIPIENKQALISKLDRSQSALEKQYPDGLNLQNLHDEKILRDLNSKYSPVGDVGTNVEATKNKSIADAARTMVEEKGAKAGIPVDEFNKALSKQHQMANYLDAINGKAVPRSIASNLAKWSAKVTGAGVASGLGGGLIGGLGGYHLGGLVESMIEGLPTKARGMFLGNLEKTNPAVFEKMNQYLTNLSDQTPSATIDAIKNSVGKEANSNIIPTEAPSKNSNLNIEPNSTPFQPKSKIGQGISNYLKDPNLGLSVQDITKSIAKKMDDGDANILNSYMSEPSMKNSMPAIDVLDRMGIDTTHMTLKDERSLITNILDEYGKTAGRPGEGLTKEVLNAPGNTMKSPLEQEALKYKSADEFVKAQGTPVYHGTAAKFETFDNNMKGSITGSQSAKGAIWLTEDPATAKAYSIYAAETGPINKLMEQHSTLEKIAQKSGKNSDWAKLDKLTQKIDDLGGYEATYDRRVNANVKETVIPSQLKLKVIDAKGKTPLELSNNDGIDSWLNTQVESAKSKGYDGLKIKNLDDAVGLYDKPATHYAIFDAKNLKTKSQLTDIWNKAHKK